MFVLWAVMSLLFLLSGVMSSRNELLARYQQAFTQMLLIELCLFLLLWFFSASGYLPFRRERVALYWVYYSGPPLTLLLVFLLRKSKTTPSETP